MWRRDCKDQQPRAARIIALAGQIVMLMAAVALEMRLEYPDPRCDERKSDRKCLKFTVVYNDHELCRWDDASGTCSVNPPPDDAFGDFSHLLVVLFVIGITLPCQKVYEWAVLDVLARTWLCSGHLWRDVEDAAVVGEVDGIGSDWHGDNGR